MRDPKLAHILVCFLADMIFQRRFQHFLPNHVLGVLNIIYISSNKNTDFLQKHTLFLSKFPNFNEKLFIEIGKFR